MSIDGLVVGRAIPSGLSGIIQPYDYAQPPTLPVYTNNLAMPMDLQDQHGNYIQGGYITDLNVEKGEIPDHIYQQIQELSEQEYKMWNEYNLLLNWADRSPDMQDYLDRDKLQQLMRRDFLYHVGGEGTDAVMFAAPDAFIPGLGAYPMKGRPADYDQKHAMMLAEYSSRIDDPRFKEALENLTEEDIAEAVHQYLDAHETMHMLVNAGVLSDEIGAESINEGLLRQHFKDIADAYRMQGNDKQAFMYEFKAGIADDREGKVEEHYRPRINKDQPDMHIGNPYKRELPYIGQPPELPELGPNNGMPHYQPEPMGPPTGLEGVDTGLSPVGYLR